MNNSFNFKVGFQQFANRCPESLKPGRESFEWYINECRRMNAHSLSMMPVEKIPEGEKYDGGYLEFADIAVSFDEVKKFVVGNLKELGRCLEGTDIMMAYENHCDFTGREIASILEEVDHPNIGGMFDIGNGAVICCDPMADVEYLAPWAVAAHFKDFKVIDNPVFEHLWQDMPMILKGCLLGEGIMDFDVIMKAICEKAKRKQNMILMAEPAFILPEKHYNCLEEMHQFDRECTYQFVDFMQKLVEKY